MNQGEDIDTFNSRYNQQINRMRYLGYNFSNHDNADKESMLVAHYLRSLDQSVVEEYVLRMEMEDRLPDTLTAAKEFIRSLFLARKGLQTNPAQALAATHLHNKEKKTKKFNRPPPSKKFCEFHKCDSHDTSECKALQRLSKRKGNNKTQQAHLMVPTDDDTSGAADTVYCATTRCAQGLHAVILDSGASDHMISDTNLLRNIMPTDRPITVSGIGETKEKITMKGTLPGFGTALVLPRGRSNLLSLAKTQEKFFIRFDNSTNTFILTAKDNSQQTYHFKNSNGVYTMEHTALHATGDILLNKAQRDRATAARNLHDLLGHPGDPALKQIIRQHLLDNINLTCQDVDHANTLYGPCIHCAAGKMGSFPARRDTSTNASIPGELVHMDIMFIRQQPYLITVDHATRFLAVCKMDDKSSNSLRVALDRIRAAYTDHGHIIRAIQSDREPGITAITSYFVEAKIQARFATAEGHEHVAERYIRTIRDRARTILHQLTYTLPATIMPWLVRHVCWCINAGANEALHEASPSQLFAKQRIDLHQLGQVKFGDTVIAKVPYQKDAMDSRGELGIFLGHSAPTKAIIYCSMTHLTSTHPRVVYRRQYQRVDAVATIQKLLPKPTEAPPPTPIITSPPLEVILPVSPPAAPTPTILETQKASEAPQPAASTVTLPVPSTPSPSHGGDVPSTVQPAEKKYNLRHQPRRDYKALAHLASTMDEAVQLELTHMLDYDVFQPAVDFTLETIPSQMLVKQKTSNTGQSGFKARLVAGGHRQAETPYSSSPTVDRKTIMLKLHDALLPKMSTEVWDVTAAYLNSSIEIPKNITLSKPTALALSKLKPEWSDQLQRNPTVTLRKALYGTKEAAYLWYQQLSKSLLEFGLQRSNVDPCLFYKKNDITVLIHVDDLLVIGNQCILNKLRRSLELQYGELTRQQGPTYKYLGMRIQLGKNTLTIDQTQMIDNIIQEQRINASVTIPHYTNNDHEEEGKPVDPTSFRSLLMKLMYVASLTRPDICTTLSRMSTVVEPQTVHMTKLHRICKYLNGTKGKYIVLRKWNKTPTLEIFCDASYGCHPDSRSHNGCVVFYNESPLFWKSTKQKVTSTSSTSAELIAATYGVTNTLPILKILQEQGISYEVKLLLDNLPSINLLKNQLATPNEFAKHSMIKLQSTRELVKDQNIQLVHVPTHQNVADFFTKLLGGTKFREFRDKLVQDHRSKCGGV